MHCDTSLGKSFFYVQVASSGPQTPAVVRLHTCSSTGEPEPRLPTGAAIVLQFSTGQLSFSQESQIWAAPVHANPAGPTLEVQKQTPSPYLSHNLQQQ